LAISIKSNSKRILEASVSVLRSASSGAVHQMVTTTHFATSLLL